MVAANARTAIVFALSPGNAHDAPEGRLLLEDLGPIPDALPMLIDRAYVTCANSARRRLISICSEVTSGLLLAPFKVPARCALTQLPKVCSTTPGLRAADAWLYKPNRLLLERKRVTSPR